MKIMNEARFDALAYEMDLFSHELNLQFNCGGANVR